MALRRGKLFAVCWALIGSMLATPAAVTTVAAAGTDDCLPQCDCDEDRATTDPQLSGADAAEDSHGKCPVDCRDCGCCRAAMSTCITPRAWRVFTTTQVARTAPPTVAHARGSHSSIFRPPRALP